MKTFAMRPNHLLRHLPRRLLSRSLTIALLSMTCLALPGLTQAQMDDGPVYELRTYTATPGNLDNLLSRFRDHTMRIFEKHGMTNVAYWVPLDPELADDTLIYILKHDSMAAAQASWQAFGADPEWHEVNEASNRNGPILDSVVRQYMTMTDFSPMLE